MQIPVFKVTQFETQFYVTTLTKNMLTKLVRFEVIKGAEPVIEALARKRKGSKISIDWKEAIKKIRISKEAYQRPILGDKIVKLAEYYDKCKSGGELPAIPGSITLVSKQKLEYVPESAQREFIGYLSIPDEEGLFTILDGQHRTFSLSLYQSGEEDKLEVPVIIFDNLAEQQSVELYVTINYYLTKLRRDQIYELSPKRIYSGEESEYEILAHKCIEKMNNDGPLAGKIKMLGVGRGIVSQSALAGELINTLREVKKNHRRIYNQMKEIFPQWIANYYKVISDIFANAWNDPKQYSIQTAIALRAFINVMPEVLYIMRSEVGGHSKGSIEKTIKCWEKIGNGFFKTEGDEWKRLGKGTRDSINNLSKELKDRLEKGWKIKF